MKITSKKEIYIERERSITIRFANRQSMRFCRSCQTDSRFVTVDEAAIMLRTTSREIFHRVEAAEIHSAETNEGLLLVCLASLLQATTISRQTNLINQENNNDTNIL